MDMTPIMANQIGKQKQTKLNLGLHKRYAARLEPYEAQKRCGYAP